MRRQWLVGMWVCGAVLGCAKKPPATLDTPEAFEGYRVIPRVDGVLCSGWRIDKTTGAGVVEIASIDPPSCTLTTRFLHDTGSTSITVSHGDAAPLTRPGSGAPYDRRLELEGDDGTAGWSLWFSQRDLVEAGLAGEDLAALDLGGMRLLVLRLWDEREGVRRAYSWTTRAEDPAVNRNSCKGDVRITAFDAMLDEQEAGFAGRPPETALISQKGACSTEQPGVFGVLIPEQESGQVGVHVEVHNWATDPFRFTLNLTEPGTVLATDVVLVHDEE